jgi:hypothetical protein
MHVRVVRFTGATEERMAGLRQRLEEADGPPEGVKSSGIRFYHDADQETMVVVQLFDSREDLESSEAALEAMDPDQTPGTRASVDRCEVIAELNA